MHNIPIIESLVKWIQEHDSTLKLIVRGNGGGGYFDIKDGDIWLGQVTLVYPGQDKQSLQYDWYRPEDHWSLIENIAGFRYYRSVFMIEDPDGFPAILKIAQDLRDKNTVRWHKMYGIDPKIKTLTPTKDSYP